MKEFAFEDRGPQVPDDCLDSRAASFCKSAREVLKNAADYCVQKGCARPGLEFVFYESEEFSAGVRLHAGVYVIGVSSKVPKALHELFEASVRTRRPSDFLLEIPPFGLDIRCESFDKEDESLNFIFEQMWSAGMWFIFNHELAHVMNGHIDFLRHFSELRERCPEDWSWCSNELVVQTLEWDADAAAVSQAVSRQAYLLSLDGPHAAFGARGLLVSWILGTYLMFREQAEVGPIFEWLEERKHMPHQMRAYHAFVLFQQCLLDRERGDSAVSASAESRRLRQEFKKLGKIVELAEIIIAQIRMTGFDQSDWTRLHARIERDFIGVNSSPIPDFVPLEQATGEDARRVFFEAYPEIWRRLRPHLIEYAKGGLAR